MIKIDFLAHIIEIEPLSKICPDGYPRVHVIAVVDPEELLDAIKRELEKEVNPDERIEINADIPY